LRRLPAGIRFSHAESRGARSVATWEGGKCDAARGDLLANARDLHSDQGQSCPRVLDFPDVAPTAQRAMQLLEDVFDLARFRYLARIDGPPSRPKIHYDWLGAGEVPMPPSRAPRSSSPAATWRFMLASKTRRTSFLPFAAWSRERPCCPLQLPPSRHLHGARRGVAPLSSWGDGASATRRPFKAPSASSAWRMAMNRSRRRLFDQSTWTKRAAGAAFARPCRRRHQISLRTS